MTLDRLIQSKEFFNSLREKAVHISESQRVPLPPQEADQHFATAAYAVAFLYQQGIEQLCQLEQKRVVHPSTIAGDSLSSAMQSLNDYFLRQQHAFQRDEYEQLARSCYSAHRLLEREGE